MKKTFSSVLATLLVATAFPAHAGPEALQGTDRLLEDAESAVAMPVRKLETGEAGYHGVARLKGLNKITAHTEELTAAIDKPVTFGTVEITLQTCWQSAAGQPFEAKALVELWENRPQPEYAKEDGAGAVVARKKLFHGWLLASRPELSGLEHPIYDLTLLGCVN